MSVKNGLSKRIVNFVKANPGCTRAELLAGCHMTDLRHAMPTYCDSVGLIHSAGPRGSLRYYPTAEQAASAHDRLVRLAEERRQRKSREWHATANLRRMERRRLKGSKGMPSQWRFKLEPGVSLHPDIKVTIAQKPRERWAV